MKKIVGINWGSTNFRAYLISNSGVLIDSYIDSIGIKGLTRSDMIEVAERCNTRWSENLPIYAAGMIGSSVGWLETPYLDCPASINCIASQLTRTEIGNVPVAILPGLRCRRLNGAPDVIRSEEIEVFGLLSKYPSLAHGEHVICLPGTHTKWVRIADGRIIEFVTCMTGELFDLLSSKSLLAPKTAAKVEVGRAFDAGLTDGGGSLFGLSRLFFGVRAQALCDGLSDDDTMSYLSGLLIGSELSDTLMMFPELAKSNTLHIVGNNKLSNLYQAALSKRGIIGIPQKTDEVAVLGFLELDRAITGGCT